MFATLTAAALSATTFSAAFDVVFVAAAVAFHAVLVFADAFLDVLAADVVGRVFVAAVTGGAAVVVAHMAGGTRGVVIAVQYKELVMVKGGRCPLGLGVALQAVAADLRVQRASRNLVAGLALRQRFLLQLAVVKLALAGKAFHPGVVTVAGHTVLAFEFLVESGAGAGLDQCHTQGAEPANVGRFVAGGALL